MSQREATNDGDFDPGGERKSPVDDDDGRIHSIPLIDVKEMTNLGRQYGEDMFGGRRDNNTQSAAHILHGSDQLNKQKIKEPDIDSVISIRTQSSGYSSHTVDSGIIPDHGSLDPDTRPKADHSIDSLSIGDEGYHEDRLLRHPRTDQLCPSFDSLGSVASFQSISSNLSSISLNSLDYPSIDRPSPDSVMLRSHTRLSQSSSSPRPSSESLITTSNQVQHKKTAANRSESWHEDSQHEDSQRNTHQELQEYAVNKMNFTQNEFEAAMLKCGPNTDRNKLLDELVKNRDETSKISYGQVKLPSQPAAAPRPAPRSSSVQQGHQGQQKPEGDSKGLRRIVIDGSNVAMEHGLHQVYSCRGIEIVVKYFQHLGHESITVFVPAHRLRTEHRQTRDQHILTDLARRGVVVKTPSRKSPRGNIASYEDRFILKLASTDKAIVVSNDQFRDLKNESSGFRETIEKRILPFVFIKDTFYPAEDPLGRKGPTLEQFLRVNPLTTNTGVCPYGRKCTYGKKCRYSHPEREEPYDSAIGSSIPSMDSSSLQPPPVPRRQQPQQQAQQQQRSGVESQQQSHQQPALTRPGSVMIHSSHQTVMRPPLPSRQAFVHQPHPAHQQLRSTSSAPYQQDHSVYQQDSGYKQDHSGYQPDPSGYQRLANTASMHQAMQYRDRYGHPDHPLIATNQPPLASRAYIHSQNDQTYNSVPLDGTFHSAQPLASRPMSRTAVAMPDSTDLSSQASYDSHQSDSSQSIGPQPLTEYVSSQPDQLASQQTRLHPHRVQPVSSEKARLMKPISTTDPRYKMYYHLCGLFNEQAVRMVLNKYPQEMDANKITEAVLLLQQSKGKK